MRIQYLETFQTIDRCVDYLVNIGCKWSYEKECELNKNSCFTFKKTLVLYDKYNILD